MLCRAARLRGGGTQFREQNENREGRLVAVPEVTIRAVSLFLWRIHWTTIPNHRQRGAQESLRKTFGFFRRQRCRHCSERPHNVISRLGEQFERVREPGAGLSRGLGRAVSMHSSIVWSRAMVDRTRAGDSPTTAVFVTTPLAATNHQILIHRSTRDSAIPRDLRVNC